MVQFVQDVTRVTATEALNHKCHVAIIYAQRWMAITLAFAVRWNRTPHKPAVTVATTPQRLCDALGGPGAHHAPSPPCSASDASCDVLRRVLPASHLSMASRL
jgi:hypothetical protein